MLQMLLFFLVLVAILFVGVRSPYLKLSGAVIATFVLVWLVLILTGHSLALFSLLNNTSLYVGVACLWALAISAGLRLVTLQRTVNISEFASPFNGIVSRRVAIFLGLTGAAALICNCILAYGLLPASPDSVVYRLPRAYWYFAQGSLHHITNAAEPRPLYYPFNGALAYMPLVHFRLGPRVFSALSLLSWLAVIFTTYSFARNLGGPRIVAAMTAWIVGLTPNILLQALSTNDEIIAAAPMLAGLFFLHRWYLGREKFDAVLGVIGVSISVGIKLHVSFYWPLLLVAAIVMGFNFRTLFSELWSWRSPRNIFVVALTLCAAFVCSISFLVYNLIDAGRLMPWEFNNQVLNTPFYLPAAIQTIILFAAEIILTPIADLHVTLDSTPRARHYEAFNQIISPLFSWVDNGPLYTSAYYRFVGINTPESVVFNEQTLFLGFSWILLLIAVAWLFRKRSGVQIVWARFQAASFPVWMITHAASTKFIWGTSVYLGYAFAVCGPALVYAFAPIARPRVNKLRWALVAFVFATQSFFAVSIFFTSSPRNLTVLARALRTDGFKSWPISRGFTIEQSVVDEIGRAKNGVYHRSIAWGQPYWAFMAYHPDIRHYFFRVLPSADDSDGTDDVSRALWYSRHNLMSPLEPGQINLYQFPKIPLYGAAIPIRVPELTSPGLTWIGDLLFSLGPEWVFAVGNNVEQRFPGRDKYIVLKFSEVSNFGRDLKPILDISSSMYGLGNRDSLEFRFEVRASGQLIDSTEWKPIPEARLNTTGVGPDNGVLTAFVRIKGAGGAVSSQDVLLRSTKATVLPDK